MHSASLTIPEKAVKFCVKAGVIQPFFFLFLTKAKINTALKSVSCFSWELVPSFMLQNLIKQKGCLGCLTAVPLCTTGCFTGSTYLEVQAREKFRTLRKMFLKFSFNVFKFLNFECIHLFQAS